MRNISHVWPIIAQLCAKFYQDLRTLTIHKEWFDEKVRNPVPGSCGRNFF
jgi:hypothetical protein